MADGSAASQQQQQDWSIVWEFFDNPHKLLTPSGGGVSKVMQDMVRNAVAEMRRYYSRKVVDVLIKVTRHSLDCLRKRFCSDSDSTGWFCLTSFSLTCSKTLKSFQTLIHVIMNHRLLRKTLMHILIGKFKILYNAYMLPETERVSPIISLNMLADKLSPYIKLFIFYGISLSCFLIITHMKLDSVIAPEGLFNFQRL
jgi:hypothetical protein